MSLQAPLLERKRKGGVQPSAGSGRSWPILLFRCCSQLFRTTGQTMKLLKWMNRKILRCLLHVEFPLRGVPCFSVTSHRLPRKLLLGVFWNPLKVRNSLCLLMTIFLSVPKTLPETPATSMTVLRVLLKPRLVMAMLHTKKGQVLRVEKSYDYCYYLYHWCHDFVLVAFGNQIFADLSRKLSRLVKTLLVTWL